VKGPEFNLSREREGERERKKRKEGGERRRRRSSFVHNKPKQGKKVSQTCNPSYLGGTGERISLRLARRIKGRPYVKNNLKQTRLET
jgi:hypothetical protein